jgi:hypothetical protein
LAQAAWSRQTREAVLKSIYGVPTFSLADIAHVMSLCDGGTLRRMAAAEAAEAGHARGLLPGPSLKNPCFSTQGCETDALTISSIWASCGVQVSGKRFLRGSSGRETVPAGFK